MPQQSPQIRRLCEWYKDHDGMLRQILPPKRQGETLSVKFDFTSALTTGESVTSGVAAISTYSGVDANPSSMLGTVGITASLVSIAVSAGVIGVIYSLKATASTNFGRIIQIAGYLYVEPDLS